MSASGGRQKSLRPLSEGTRRLCNMQGMWDGATPIAGRECGECTLCCSVLLIDAPEIQKDAGIRCLHCDQGCVIYEQRPAVCRDFYCAWRTMAIFDEAWRPDRRLACSCKSRPKTFPNISNSRSGIGLMLVANPLKTIRQGWFIDFVATGLRMAVPLFLSLPGPASGGQTVSQRRCARHRRGERRPQDRQGVDWKKSLKRLSSHPFRPTNMRNRGNDTAG